MKSGPRRILCRNVRPARRGFTLVELLVVVVIIGLLLGVLLPALNSSLQSSRSASCKGNLKQLGQGFGLYVADHGDWLPTWIENTATENVEDWIWYLREGYDISAPETTMCRSNRYSVKGKYGIQVNYSIHTGLRYLGGPVRSVSYRSLAQTGLLVDGLGTWIKSIQPERVARVHPGQTANILYLDWHVDSYTPDEELEEFYYWYWYDS